MAQIIINNKNVVGKSISIINGKVIIDGKEVETDEKIINITVEGDVDSISADVCHYVSVNGAVGSVQTVSGDVNCMAEVNGDIQTTSGDVDCMDVKGSVKTVSGNVSCGNVAGSVDTLSGDIKHKK